MARQFCPTIRIQCSRAHARGESSLYKGKKGIRSRAAKFKQAKARLLKQFRGLGNVHPYAESTSLPPSLKVAAAKVAHAVANEARCTVSLGGRRWKKLTGAKAGAKVAALRRELAAGGCCNPKVTRG